MVTDGHHCVFVLLHQRLSLMDRCGLQAGQDRTVKHTLTNKHSYFLSFLQNETWLVSLKHQCCKNKLFIKLNL